MYIKRYTLSALVFMIIVGWYVYAFITQDIRSITVFGTELPAMPIALWVVMPVVILYIASVLHMSYYGLLASLKKRKFQKDHENLVDSLRDAFLGKANRYTQYKTGAYAVIGKVLDKSAVIPDKSLTETGNEKIDAALGMIREIENGNIVELKKFQLDKENPLAIQNGLNRLERGKVTPEDILGRSERYAEHVNRAAYIKLVATAPMYAIEKYKAFISKEALLVIASRINADEHTLEAANDTLISLIGEVSLNENDFIQLSVALSRYAVPDQRIKLFEMLATANDEATPAYLYTLFDLEMLAPADEILENSQPDEYMNFKAYRALKECNRPFSIDLFVPALK